MSLALQDYAKAKKLDASFLRALGISEAHDKDGPYLRLPYRDETGSELSVRFRLALDGPGRFRWRSGAKAFLYGLDRIADARRQRMVVLVEGESDCHTLWQAGIPALGLPGNTTWQEARDAPLLEGIERVFIIREPGASGEGMMRWLSRSAIRHRARIVALGEAKDPSALHLMDPGTFYDRMSDALLRAVPFHAIEAETKSTEAKAAFEICRALAEAPDILAAFRESLAALSLVGEDRNAQALYLALTSRLLANPVSIAVKGPSSGGKSYLVDRTLDHFPESAYLRFAGMSERALFYLDDDISHRHLVFAEGQGAEGEMQSYVLRTLLSEGRLSYASVEKTQKGLAQRRIEKEGPTGLVLTTTKIRVHEENETRLISLTANDTRDQTRAVMRSIAAREAGAAAAVSPQWPALQSWLALGERRVTLPFMRAVAELASQSAVRMRRDFGAVKSLIEAHALLHRASRARDHEGRIVATLADYAAVRGLVADLIAEGHAATVKPQVREVVEAVKALAASGGGSATGRAIAGRLGLDESSTNRRCLEAVRAGFLVNQETVRGKKARLIHAVVSLPTSHW